MCQSKKKRRKVLFITLSPTRIEVTSFNDLDSRIHNDAGQTLGSGRRCIEDTQSNSDVSWYSLDNEETIE
jgi:hypothetical protein